MNMYKLFGWIINRIRKQVTKLILIRFLGFGQCLETKNTYDGYEFRTHVNDNTYDVYESRTHVNDNTCDMYESRTHINNNSYDGYESRTHVNDNTYDGY